MSLLVHPEDRAVGDGSPARASMRLLLFNLAVDSDHPIWGFTTTWIEALAKRVASVRVITVRAGRSTMPSNVRVYSVGGERGYSKVRKVATFYRHLEHVLRNDRVDICFSHMIATFSVLAAPLLKIHGVPLVTWHAHPEPNWTLRAAHHLSDRMVTSLSTTYPYHRDKVAVVGQGIDTSLFGSDHQAPDDPPVILCIGRLSPVKEHPTLLKAVDLLRQRWPQPFRVVIVGGAAQPSDEGFITSLHEMRRALRLEDIVHFEPATPLATLPEWYRRSAIHVNMTCVGSGDKVALEAMSCGRPSVVANAGFRDTLGRYTGALLSRSRDPEDLAEKLKMLLALPPAARHNMGVYLREQVVRMHSLDLLADRLVGVFRDVLH